MSAATLSLPQVIAQTDARSQRAIARSGMLIVKRISEHVGKQIRLSDADKIRAFRWIVWARRHQVSLAYIVSKSFEWGNGVATKRIKYRRRANVLPLAISSLVSPACYAFVKDQISDDFKGADATESLKSKMIDDTLVLPEHARLKGPLEYETQDAYVAAYADDVRNRRVLRLRAERSLAQTKPFRGNPFR